MNRGLPFIILFAIACTDKSDSIDDSDINEPSEQTDPTHVDNDGDGWTEAQGDCDDTDPSINPSATEVQSEGGRTSGDSGGTQGFLLSGLVSNLR